MSISCLLGDIDPIFNIKFPFHVLLIDMVLIFKTFKNFYFMFCSEDTDPKLKVFKTCSTDLHDDSIPVFSPKQQIVDFQDVEISKRMFSEKDSGFYLGVFEVS